MNVGTWTYAGKSKMYSRTHSMGGDSHTLIVSNLPTINWLCKFGANPSTTFHNLVHKYRHGHGRYRKRTLFSYVLCISSKVTCIALVDPAGLQYIVRVATRYTSPLSSPRGRPSTSRAAEQTQRSSTFPGPIRSHGHRCTCACTGAYIMGVASRWEGDATPRIYAHVQAQIMS